MMETEKHNIVSVWSLMMVDVWLSDRSLIRSVVSDQMASSPTLFTCHLSFHLHKCVLIAQFDHYEENKNPEVDNKWPGFEKLASLK